MSFGLLIAGIIISVIALLTTLILAIIALATGKQRNGLIYGFAFLMSLVLAILCITETVKRGSDKVADGLAWIKEMDEKNKSHSNSYSSYNDTYYAYIPEWNKDTVKAEFYYSYNNDDSTYYIPLVYPYRFTCASSSLECGSLENFSSGKKDPKMKAVTSFAFNDKLLIAKGDNSFMVFNFETGDCELFDSETEMETAAKRDGFSAAASMDSFSTHFWKYSDSQEYD